MSLDTDIDVPDNETPPPDSDRKLFVLTCMDPRTDPRNFGIELGSAYVCRNAGGRAVEALRSIIVSQQCLGTNEIMVVHHTNCGMLGNTDDKIRDWVERNLRADASHIAFLPMRSLMDSVVLDVQFLKNSALVQKVPITGYIYNVDNKTLERVC